MRERGWERESGKSTDLGVEGGDKGGMEDEVAV